MLQRQDWGESIVSAAEIANLKQWIVQDNCRLVTLLGRWNWQNLWL